MEVVSDIDGFKYSKEDICRMCNVSSKTFDCFVGSSSISNRDFISIGSIHEKFYNEDILNKFQLWLMKNKLSQGTETNGGVVEYNLNIDFQLGTLANIALTSGNIEAAKQFSDGRQLISSTYKSELSTNLTVLENEVTLMGKIFNVYGTVEEPLFKAKDVAEWIEHSNVSAMIQSIDEDEKFTINIYYSE